MPSPTDHADFEIELRSDQGGFEARVLTAPLQGRVGMRFFPPFSAGELQDLLTALERRVRASAGRLEPESGAAELTPASQPSADAAHVGRSLFEALFSGPILAWFRSSLDSVQSRPEASGLRSLRMCVRLTFDREEDFARLAALPWELLLDGRQFLALDRRTPIVRSHNRRSVPKPVAGLPLRVLLVDSRPTDLPALGTGREAELIEAALARNQLIQPIRLKHPSVSLLRDKLEAERCQILHFMGHGTLGEHGEGGFALCFEDAWGRAEEVTGRVLAENLKDLPELRLVVLSSCWGAALPRRQGQDPYTGVAAALMVRDVPAVVAMQFPITDEAAIAFAETFYRRLAAGDSVSEAVTEGRIKLFCRDEHSLEWATPTLFLAGSDRLFEVSSGPALVPATAGEASIARVPPPGWLRRRLDRSLPALHRCLAALHIVPRPKELETVLSELDGITSRIRHEVLREKTYIPLLATRARITSQRREFGWRDPFLRRALRHLRRQLDPVAASDAATAPAAASGRRSRPIRHLGRALRRSREPLVILGAPGSGKTLTLKQTALSFLQYERRRLYPRVVLEVRLGGFHVEAGLPTLEDVRRLVYRACPPGLQPYFDSLLEAGRLIILFDGLDEMSRDGYNDHTSALSKFALDVTSRGGTCILTCRRHDLSPELMYDQLLLLPYTRSQIKRYLKRSLAAARVNVDGERISVRELASRIATGAEAVDGRNPFVLSLYPLFLDRQSALPRSRMELLEEFVAHRHSSKLRQAREEGRSLAPFEVACLAWSRIAWLITERNRGTEMPLEVLARDLGETREGLASVIEAGKVSGILHEFLVEDADQIRFVHHLFQEYFAARWIQSQGPAIQWLEKLDAPRWQETMLNAVLLGCAAEGIEALAVSLEAELQELRRSLARQEAWERAAAATAETERRRAQSQNPERPSQEEGEPRPADEPGVDPVSAAAPPPPFYRQEAALADRVVFGARLLAEGARVSPAVGRRLRPCVREAVELLGERGKPITQVKMMRACQGLDDPAISELLVPKLRSPLRWVREQALTLVEADLPTEMGIDLATCSLLPRWPVFLRATRAKHARRSWRVALALATALGVAHIAALLACARALGLWTLPVLRFLDTEVSDSVLSALGRSSTERLLAGQTLATAAAALLALATRPSRIWLWCLVSAPLGIATLYICAGLWDDNWEALALPFVGCWLVLAAVPLLAMVGAAVHGLVLAGYCVVSRSLRHTTTGRPKALRSGANGSSGHATSAEGGPGLFVFTLATLAWNECGYAAQAALLRRFVILAPVVVVLALLFGSAVFGFSSATEWLSESVGVAYLEGVSELGLVALIAALAYLGYRMSHSVGRSLPGRLARGLVEGLLHIGRAAFLIAVVIVFASAVGVLGIWGLEGTEGLLARLPGRTFISKALVLWASVWALLWFSKQLFSYLRSWLWMADHTTDPSAWTLGGWTARLESSSPREQEYLLRSTSHRRLHLERSAFLHLLETVEPLISEEPAKSAYWSRRDQVDQALQRERRG